MRQSQLNKAILPYYFHAINHRGQLVTIKIRVIEQDEPEEELNIFARSMARIFTTSEPTTIAAGLTEEEFFEEIYLYLQFAKKDGLSLILTNEATGKIIGGIIGRDFYNDENEDAFVNLTNREKFQPVFDLLDISKRDFISILENEGHTLHPGLVYRGFFVGFLGKYLKLNNEEGANLTALSFRKFEEYLAGLGFKYFYGEATNPGSQKLFRNSGWTIDEIVIPYASHNTFKHIDFQKNGLPGINNALCGSIQRLSSNFPPVPNNLLERYSTEKNLSIGFPHNMDIQNSHLSNYLNFHINNAGDPKNHSNYQLHARDEEQAVLNFISNLYKLSSSEMWGYITAGGMEANEMAMYLARCKYPDGIIYASEESHYSVRVCSNKLRMPLCEIPKLKNGEINYTLFEEKIRENKFPAIVNVNIGTTMTGAIDNLSKIINILTAAEKEFYIHCDAALHGGFIPFLEGAPDISFHLPIDSLAISLHKFLGMPFPAATFICRGNLLDNIPQNLTKTSYNGKRTNTLSCSRNGQAAIFAYSRIIQLGGIEGMTKISNECIALAKYTVSRLKETGYPAVILNDFSNIVVISTPPLSICKKWQLPIDKELSHIIVMPHVTKAIIDDFISDLKTITTQQQAVNVSKERELAIPL